MAERLRNRGAWIRAGLAVLAAGAAAFLCLFEQLLAFRSGGTADAMLARLTAEKLNDAGIEPYDEVDNADWTRP